MSLIVVRKSENMLSVVSDTKLTYPNQDVKGLKNDPSEGIIKSVIINPDVCISFAGEVDYAEKAMCEILDNDPVDKIIETLKKFHTQSNYKTEFLLCYAKPELTIYKVKNNEYGSVVSSWIGDQKAFSYFQENMSGIKNKTTPEKKNTKTTLPVSDKPAIIFEAMNLSFEPSLPQYLAKMSSAMDEVIEAGNVNSVGGFKVNVIYKEKFYYNFYTKSYRGQFAMIGQGTHNIGHGGAEEGAYSLNFFGGSNDFKCVALHIKQANLGIVYFKENSGLLRPQLFKMDEVDFSDLVKERFQLHAPMLTQDRGQKFTLDGRKAFELNDFEKANGYFDKAIESLKDKNKAEILFFKGVTLLNLRNIPHAMEAFQTAITIDPSIQRRVNLLFRQGPTK